MVRAQFAWVAVAALAGGCGAGSEGAVGVRGAGARERYRADSDVVVDVQTSLEWQRLFAPRVFRWHEGKQYCEGLTLARRTDWRLPTAAELRTIAVHDTFGGDAAIDLSIFPNTPAAAFWSARPREERQPGGPMSGAEDVVHFGQRGVAFWSAVSSQAFVRCVRGRALPGTLPRVLYKHRSDQEAR